MIRIFGKTDREFISNGDMVVKPLKARVVNSDNGDYYLNLETGLQYVDYITEGRVAVANTPQGEQAFRIHNVTKTKNKITAKCYHVFYDTEDYLIASCSFSDLNCAEALAMVNASTEPVSAFTTSSNIANTNSLTIERDSLYNAIQAILTAYGGHLVRNNFHISIRASIGSDKGVTVRYRKNLKEITCQENWDYVVTKILPVGRDGTLLNALDPTADIYIESTTQYDLPYVKSVSFTQDINREDYSSDTEYTQALVNDLRAQATAYLEQNSLPQVSYSLRANLDEITDVGDVVEVIDERLGVDILTNVTGYEYDCLLKKYTEIQFGNYTQTLGNLIANITGSVNRSVNVQTQTIEDSVADVQRSTDGIINIMTGSYVIYDGANIYVLDSLPYTSATNVLKINKDGIEHSANGINGTFTDVVDITGRLNVDLVYPVGSIYMTTSNTLPDALFGGTWSLVSGTPTWAGKVYKRTA